MVLYPQAINWEIKSNKSISRFVLFWNLTSSFFIFILDSSALCLIMCIYINQCKNIASELFLYSVLHCICHIIGQFRKLLPCYYNMLSLETPSDVWPLHLSLISYHASLAISQHPPAQKPPTVTHRMRSSWFLIHCNLGHLHRSVRICLKITRSISLEG